MSAMGDLEQAGGECLGPLEQILGGLSRVTLQTAVTRLVRRGSMLWARDDSCVHCEAPLSDCWLRQGVVVCPGTGLVGPRPRAGPSTQPPPLPKPVPEVKVEGGPVLVCTPSA